MMRVSGAFAAILGLLWACNSTAWAWPELEPLIQFEALVTESEAHAAGIVGEHSRRFSRVTLNLNSLNIPVDRRSDRQASGAHGDRPQTPAVGQTVEIEAFENERYRLRGRYVEAADDGLWTWVADVQGHEHGDAVLTIDGSTVPCAWTT